MIFVVYLSCVIALAGLKRTGGFLYNFLILSMYTIPSVITFLGGLLFFLVENNIMGTIMFLISTVLAYYFVGKFTEED